MHQNVAESLQDNNELNENLVVLSSHSSFALCAFLRISYFVNPFSPNQFISI